jgi:hypothetical protein
MSLDTVREWATWFGTVVGVKTTIPPVPQEIEMVDFSTLKPKKPEISPEIVQLKSEMDTHRKNLDEAAGGGAKRLKKLQDMAATADAAINDNDAVTGRVAVNALALEMANKPPKMGEKTGKTDGELVEAWNSKTEKNEFHHPDEWKRLVERGGGGTMVGESKPMINLGKSQAKYYFDKDEKKLKLMNGPEEKTGVFIQAHDNQFIGTYETHIRWERESTQGMRSGMTDNVNKREGKAKAGVANNCDMADKIAGVIGANPELLAKGGLLTRIAGKVEGQGQHDVNTENLDEGSVTKVIEDITGASKRLKEGKGEEGDANKIMQLIGCFTDGLTEVLEYQNGDQSKKKAAEQFEKAWPSLRDAFGLEDGDKEKLLKRVEGYKEIAGGVADTISGKGTRKGKTRFGEMPDDPRYKISDEDALIKNDISGSMHSSLLAQELSESLVGGKPIKGKGDPVVVTDKGLLDARAFDALALTAGGLDRGTDKDFVMHTAYEMINGMRAITGGPEVDEAGASYIIRQMGKGASFTDAMEDLFKPEQLPWMAGQVEGPKSEPGPLDKLKKQMAACEYRLSKDMDGAKYRPTDILDLVSYTKSEIKDFEDRTGKITDKSATAELETKITAIKELLQLFVQSAMIRAAEALEVQQKAMVAESERIAAALLQSPDAETRKTLYQAANAALVKADGQINDWNTQLAEGNGLPGITTLAGPLGEMAAAQEALERLMPQLLPKLTGKPAKDDGSTTTAVPPEMVIRDEKHAEQVLIECKDWSEAKKRYAQYKSEMQKLANFRQKVVDEWLNANLRDKYGLKKAANEGWVSVGSQDPTSDYDISVNKHSLNEDGSIRKYDYEMVEEFNKHFRGVYGCETGTIFDTNLYASAPALQLGPREGEKPEEAAAREKVKASNDIGALMKQRRYMSGPEFNDYMVSVLQGIPEDKQEEVADRFQQADDNYRVSLQKTVEVLVKEVAKTVKKLEDEGGHDEEVEELKALLKREQGIRSTSGSDIISGTDALEHLVHDLEHACKDSNTQSTNDLYVDATKEVRAVEGKITGLQACQTSADKLQKAAKALADLPETASAEERDTATKSVDGLKSELAAAVKKLNDTRLSDVPKAIEDGRLDDAASALSRLAPELFADLGRSLSMSNFFANEAYQSGGPFKHVVYAGQAVEGDVLAGAAKPDNDQKKIEDTEKKRLELELKQILARLETNKTATEQPGADQDALQAERDDLTRQFAALGDGVAEQDKKIKELDGKIQAAIAAERKKRRGEIEPSECLDTFNEQLGDFLKDLAHYGDADPGVAIIQSSKYLDRLLDAVSLISDRGLIEDDALASEAEAQVARMKTVQDQLIKARKGQIKMVPPEGGQPFSPAEELEQRRALACDIMGKWGINSVASLHRTYADLGKKINIEARKNMAGAG